MGDVQVGSADGHAWHGRVSRARCRWSRAPPGAAQSAAPFWSLLFPKSRFFSRASSGMRQETGSGDAYHRGGLTF
eukprot:3899235-Prymnesium_polylepis.1